MRFSHIVFVAFMLFATATAQEKSGEYTLVIQGEKLGTTSYKSLPNGSMQTVSKLQIGNQKIDFSFTHTQVNGRHKKISGTTNGTKFEYVWTKGNIQVISGKNKTTVKAPDTIAFFGNYAPHLIKTLLDQYSVKKGGKQMIKAFLVDAAAVLDISVEFIEKHEQVINGKKQSTLNYKLSLVGVEILIYANEKHHVLAWNVPAQQYKAYLKNYEVLVASTEPADPLLSKPTYTVKTDSKVMVPMRDGVKLAVDVYRPAKESKYPVILNRTPYSRKNKLLEGPYYARRGYVYVAMDCRGRYDSEGEWEPFINEPPDGYDSVQWCAEQDWSDGNVGMIGASYEGWVQWHAAKEHPPALKCLIPMVPPTDPFLDFPYRYGVFFLTGAIWWANIVAEREANLSFTGAGKLSKALNKLPLDQVDNVMGKNIPFFDKWIENDTYNDYWKRIGFLDAMKEIDLPALHISGWFDGSCNATRINYMTMVGYGKPNQHLLYGPWPHAINSTTKMGALDFGAGAIIALDETCLRWFDHWLKGIDNGVEKQPPVRVFVMRENKWRTFTAWPPAEAEAQRWYLSSDGMANGIKGNGRLLREEPGNEEPDRFFYYPADAELPADTAVDLTKQSEGGPVDMNKGEAFKELHEKSLVYTSAPLEQTAVIAGPVRVKLYAATSAKDTDWVGVLANVTPDGKCIFLTYGMMRAKFRESYENPTLLEPGKVYEYTLELSNTAIKLEKGHRLRLYLDSSFFPVVDRNLGTGEPLKGATRMLPAHQTIYHEPGKESYLEVYVVRE
jgi:putative CocE/NonD family hydrolase